MSAPVAIESKQAPHDKGVTFYRLTGESFDDVQREVETIGERGVGKFTLPRFEQGKYIARGVLVTEGA